MATSRRCCALLVERKRAVPPPCGSPVARTSQAIYRSPLMCARPEIHVISGDLPCCSCVADARCHRTSIYSLCGNADEWYLVRRKAAAKAESTAKQNWAYPGTYRPVSGRPSAADAAGFRRVPGCSAVACAPGRAGALSHAQLSLRPLLRQPTVLRTCAGA